jgi:DNA-binding MarR family transcriptional regulator
MAESPLKPDEYAVYSLLYDTGPITPSEMAQLLGMPATTMSDYARTMVERRHAIRHPNPEDQRSYRLALSRRGVAAHDVAMEWFRLAWRPFLKRLEASRRSEARARSVVQAIGRAAEEALTDFDAAMDVNQQTS